MRLALLFVALAGCSSSGPRQLSFDAAGDAAGDARADGSVPGDGGGAGPVALFDTSPGRADFFALPWPSDARLLGQGAAARLDLAGLPNPGGLIGLYLATVGGEGLGGFGTSSAIYFRFDGPLDPASLPADASAAVASTASAFVVDVTPGSPTAGQRVPVQAAFRGSSSRYLGENALVLLPEPGFPLRPATTYAAVVTDRLRGPTGLAARADHRFTLPPLKVPLPVEAQHVVCATVFTTMDPVAGMKALRAAVYASGPTPAIDGGSLRYLDSPGGLFDRYQGTFASPSFQQGDPPYLRSGGGIAFDGGGVPRISRVEHLRFMVTVPTATMPVAGFPVVLYAHGTGGSYSSFVDDGSAQAAALVSDDHGQPIARLAMISIDQPNHGPRDPTGADPNLTTYNIENLTSSRDIFRQGGADDFQLLRLVKSMAVALAPGSGRPIRFDPTRIYFKGHSEGGTTGPLFLAFEPEVKAAVLSGAGANLLLALLSKTQPVDSKALLTALLGEDADQYHPIMNLVQTYLEPADPGNYGRLFFREPPPPLPPKSIYQSLGLIDHYAPVPTLKALALAIGVPPAGRMLEPIGDLALAGLSWTAPPLVGNVAGGAATGAVVEYRVPTTVGGKQVYDGHFVVFDHPDAVRQSNRFLARAAASGRAQLDP